MIFFFQSSNDADFYPVHLPDDVPVDFLEGRMDLKVVLPSEKTVRMSVERRYSNPNINSLFQKIKFYGFEAVILTKTEFFDHKTVPNCNFSPIEVSNIEMFGNFDFQILGL